MIFRFIKFNINSGGVLPQGADQSAYHDDDFALGRRRGEPGREIRQRAALEALVHFGEFQADGGGARS